MGIESILNIAASSMSAENIRLSLTAKNIANSGTVASTPEDTYRAKYPVFSEVQERVAGIIDNEQPLGGVRVTDVTQSDKPLNWQMDPDNPLADADGKVYVTDVNTIQEMAQMISASKQYQASVEVMSTTKNLLAQTIKAINNY